MVYYGTIACFFQAVSVFKVTVGMDLRASRVLSYTKTDSGFTSKSSNSSAQVSYYSPPNSYSDGTVQVNTPSLVLKKDHIVTNVPQVRKYDWVVENKTAAFDGFVRNVFVINNQFPGPLIEANEGDTIVVNVKNELNLPLSIHWHGIYQNGSQWMDGVSGVTQCPQQPGTTFTYQFTVNNQFGTFWYHAHYEALLADGVSGPLIIHSTRDPLVRGRDFDNEQIIFMNDWYHDPSTTITRKLLSTEGYNGTLAAPSPNTALLNGIGFFNCEKYGNGEPCQTNHNPLEIQVPPNARSRLRLIQAGSHALFKVSIDGHPLEVIEADATPVRSSELFHRVPLHNAERYSVILDTRSDVEGESFYFRAAMDTDCFAWLAPGMDTAEGNTALAVVRVSSTPLANGNTRARMPVPNTVDWKDDVDGLCVDLDQTKLSPLINPNVNFNSHGRVYFNTSFGTIVDSSKKGPKNILGRFFVDNTTWTPRESQPLLPQLMSGGSGNLNPADVAIQTISEPGIWDVVVNNLDQAIDHPIHLHGVDTCVVATGNGTLTDANYQTAQYQLENPVCRDVHVVPGGSYLVMRIKADNPGVWIIHCHIDWHLAGGFAGMLVIQPNALKQTVLPQANQGLCPKGGGLTTQN
ncbi:laccase, multicopper oxidase, benzenediol:oxygen oxidorectuctase [Puccinia graminis f. sp. tritici]|nr:laccase, multicopper oxidase, benzenediol:oxygen oxidorectuctase [Puccinia graminis f. sp. tritici]